jgi:hypothetical protein
LKADGAPIAETSEQMRILAARLIKGNKSCVFVAEVEKSKPVAMFGVVVEEHSPSGVRIAAEIFRAAAGARLYHAVSRWAAKKGAEDLEMLVYTSPNGDARGAHRRTAGSASGKGRSLHRRRREEDQLDLIVST